MPAMTTITTGNIMVLDMSKNLHLQLDSEYYKQGELWRSSNIKTHYTTVQLLKTALANIQSHATQYSSRSATNICCKNSQLLIVGTHLDLCGDTEDKIRKRLQEVEKTICDDVLHDCSPISIIQRRRGKKTKIIHPIANRSDKDSDEVTKDREKAAQEIRTAIESMSYNDNVNKEIPVSWLLFQYEIKLQSGPCILRSDCEEIAKKCYIDEAEIDDVLSFFHEVGILLCYKQVKKLEHVVFSDPQWLFNQLTKIIELKYDPSYEAEKSIKKGIFKKKILAEIFGKEFEPKQKLHYEDLLSLFIHLNIMASLSDTEEQYFMPALLNPAPIYIPLDEEFGNKIFSTLYIKYKEGLFPRGVFCCLIALSIQKNKTWKLQTNAAYKDVVVFQIESNREYLILFDKINYILVEIHRKDNFLPNSHQVLCYKLHENLIEVCSKIHLKEENFNFCFLCENCESSESFASVQVQHPRYPENLLCAVCQSNPKMTYDQLIWFIPPNVMDSSNTKHSRGSDDYLWTQQELQESVSDAIKPLPKEIQAEVLYSVLVWLVTVDTNEILAAKIYLQKLDGHEKVYQFSKRISQSGQQTKDIIYYIGNYGTCPAVISDVSPSFEVHGSTSNVSMVTHELFPNLSAVISVGIAHGVENKVKICDVLVSSKVLYHDKAMDENGKYLVKEQIIPMSQQLIKLFDQPVSWPNQQIQTRLNDNKVSIPTVKSGMILSIKTTVLKNIDSEVIGIEKGEANLFSEIQHNKANIIIVKTVSAFRDDMKSNLYQPTAALLAADLVHKCLNSSHALKLFTAKKELRQMVQQAKDEGLTINVRHAKVLFCGASQAGKTSFYRLLRNKNHKDVGSTPVGHAKQVLVSGKVNVVGTNWVDLDSKLETEQLTKRLILKLRKSNSTDENNLAVNNNANTEYSAIKDNNKKGNDSMQLKKQFVGSPISNDANSNPHISTAASKPTTITPKSNNQTVTEPMYGNVIKVSNSELKGNTSENQYPVSATDRLQSLTEDQMAFYNESVNTPISELEESIPDTWDLFTLLDTGGQPEFINMLPAINASTDITFVVLNLSEGKECLKTPVIAQYKREGYNYTKHELNYTNMDLLKCLLSSIKIAAMQKNKSISHHDIIKTVKGDEHPQPIVCIIGTHADGLKGNLNDVTSYVNKKISELEVIKKNDNKVMVIWSDSKGIYLRPVDNTVPRDLQERSGLQNSMTPDIQAMTIKTIEVIRDSSKKLLEKKMQYEIPISWFILELELRKFCEKNKKVCISLDDIKEKICDKIMPSGRRMEKLLIIEVMKFYHMFGTLLFFDEVNGMNGFVITDPQWLFTNLTEIVTCTFDENHVCYDANHINKLRNEGICNIDLLRNLNLNLQDIEMESFLKLLVHLKVIAPKHHNEYFIPSVLPRLNRKIDNKCIFNEEYFGKAVAFTADGHTIEVDPLLIEFTFGTIPRGLFGFLAVQILQDNHPLYQLYSDNDPDNNIYYCCADLITFQVEPCWYVTLIDNISYLELQVRVQEENRISYHQQIQKTVTAALKKVCDQFVWQFSDCRYGFSCKKCLNDYSIMDHLSVLSPEEPIPSQLPDYIKCSRDHRMKLEEKQKLWFKDIVQQPDDKIIIESFDCSTVEKMLRKEYKQLSNLPYTSMYKQLFAEDVITLDEKLQIEGKIGTEQMAKLLDIIITDLRLGMTTKYLGFLKAMKESEDTTLKKTAKRLATATISSRCDSSKPLPKRPKTESHNKDEDDQDYMSPNNEKSKDERNVKVKERSRESSRRSRSVSRSERNLDSNVSRSREHSHKSRSDSRDKSTKKHKERFNSNIGETSRVKASRPHSRSIEKDIACRRSRSRERKSRGHYSICHTTDATTSISKSRSPLRKGSSRKHKRQRHRSRSASKSRHRSKSPSNESSSYKKYRK